MPRKTFVRKSIAAVPMFEFCSAQELEELDRLVDEVTIPAGEPLIKEGDSGAEFFIVESGRCAVSVNGKQVAEIGPGGYFGELALIGEARRDAQVTAIENMDVIVIGRREFQTLLRKVPSLSMTLLEGMARRLQKADRQQA
jgi:CRP-like cAMP-binding protein